MVTRKAADRLAVEWFIIDPCFQESEARLGDIYSQHRPRHDLRTSSTRTLRINVDKRLDLGEDAVALRLLCSWRHIPARKTSIASVEVLSLDNSRYFRKSISAQGRWQKNKSGGFLKARSAPACPDARPPPCADGPRRLLSSDRPERWATATARPQDPAGSAARNDAPKRCVVRWVGCAW